MKLGFQLHDPDSSSSQSTQSNHDLAGHGGANSQDQCISSESGQEVSCGRGAGQQVKPVFFMGHPSNTFNLAGIDYSHARTSIPYPCADPYFNGLLAAYGPQCVMAGTTPACMRLPLANVSDDEPIYVNAKQYHGILRRRQLRAKLEAQNKLIKARKPYLHESRHRHALSRVRGSGGRFLSTKKPPQRGGPDSSGEGPHSGSSSSGIGQHQPRGTEIVVFQEVDRGYPGIGGRENIGGNGRLMSNPLNQQYAAAPVVR